MSGQVPFILGLTGAIGMGKTWVATAFRAQGVPVFDSDKEVHALLGPNSKAASMVGEMFPQAIDKDATINRHKLGKIVFNDVEKLTDLENILHPMVDDMQYNFLSAHARRRTPVVVLDIPLLFETGGEIKTDAVTCVYAPRYVQRPRVLARPGMSEQRLKSIEQNQFSADAKCEMADFIISTGTTRADSLRQVRSLLKVIKKLSAQVWGPHWGK